MMPQPFFVVAAPVQPPRPTLVPHEVSATKLGRQLEQWSANDELYRSRGWLLLGVDDLQVDVGFLAAVPTGGAPLPVLSACIRLRYDNFDLWPPSLTFVDPFTRQPTIPMVSAPDRVGDEVRNALVEGHPLTGLPFLCLPGIREYHEHPQHSGDDWLVHRSQGAGNLSVICERVWRRMARNVIALQFTTVMLPAPAAPQVQTVLVQGDPDQLAAQLAAAQGFMRTSPQPGDLVGAVVSGDLDGAVSEAVATPSPAWPGSGPQPGSMP